MFFIQPASDGNLLFIEEIFKDEEDKETFFVAQELSQINLRDQFTVFPIDQSVQKITEGKYYIQSSESFTNGNKHPVARREVYRNNVFRGALIKRSSKESVFNRIGKEAFAYSYHVNVGHGNCSVIVIGDGKKIRIWMVDCSNFDFLQRKDYQSNIDFCFEHIKSTFGLKAIFVEAFVLTHSHFDHYSGINTLIKKEFINSQTIFYLNPYYSMPSQNHTALLESIHRLKCPIVLPIEASSNSIVEFWHPINPLVRTNTRQYPKENFTAESRVNNTSSVFQLRINGKSMVFTGDIEKQGWNRIKGCNLYLKNSSFYVVSHHGSINGHLRNDCPIKNKIENIKLCASKVKHSIIMGRNGAYKGIYSPGVLEDLSPTVLFSEKEPHGKETKFLEINWDTENPTWY